MPLYAKPEAEMLRITFSRDGEDDEQRVAPNGSIAVSIAMHMLMLKEELQPGDTLVVRANKPPPIV